MSARHTHDSPDGCSCYAAGYADSQETVEGVLAAAFARHPELSRDAWQDALTRVSRREYQRGLDEARADD